MDSSRERESGERAAPAPIADALAPASAPPGPGGPLTPGAVVALQRSAGNAAVADMLAADAAAAAAEPPPPGLPTLARQPAAAPEKPKGPAAPNGSAAGTDRGGAAAANGTAAPAASNGSAATTAGTEGGGAAAANGSAATTAGTDGGGAAAANGSAATAASNGSAATTAGTEGGGAAANGSAAPAAARAGGAAAAANGSAATTAGTDGGGGAAASNGSAAPAAAREGGAAAANGSAAPAAAREGGAAAAASGAAPKGPAAGAGAAAPAADGPAPKLDPKQDPRFQAMQGRAKTAAAGEKTHAPPASGAAAAQAAAEPPGNEVDSQAAAAQVDEMSEQKPGAFDRKAFIAAVKEAIANAAPKNLEEADEFAESGKAGEVKDAVHGEVKGGKEGAEKDIKTSTEKAPDKSKGKPKPVTPMKNDDPGGGPEAVDAAKAMPPPKGAKETDLSKGPQDVEAKMAEAEVTDEQLQKSNEPDFTGALKKRDEAKQHSDEAPAGYRKQEQGVLGKAEGEAEAAAAPGLTGMHGSRVEAFAKAVGSKQDAKGADEKKRAKVASDIEAIYDRTKKDVTGILDGLDGKVDSKFNDGEGKARKAFEKYVGDRMSAYKDERYSGVIGKGRWVKDKLMGMPEEVNAFYDEGKTGYLEAMDVVIGDVADIVGAELTRARTRIAEGRKEVAKYVAQLPKDLQQVGKDAEKDLQDRFDQLSSDVDSKQDELVDAVAQKYVKARDELDARIDELKAANRGLVDKAMDAIGGVIKTILQLKDMLLNVLSKAASVIADIIADPIGFLGNLVSGVKTGLSNFLGRIGTHLQNALLNWLFGALGNAGLVMPAKLDLAGILDLVMQVIGLTYANIRNRVAKLVGEKAVGQMEQTVDVFKVIATQGVGGLWEFIKDQVGNLEELVIGQIKEFVIEKVIKNGITWIMALMNPAGAFIRACKAIVDIVMWVVERGAQLMEFVNAVLDGIAAVAKGNLGAMAAKVEDALAKALPLAISFLASLIGLGGISEKIRSIIETVQRPINKAVDAVVLKAVKAFKKVKGKVKGKYDAAKQWGKDKLQAGKDRLGALDPRKRKRRDDEPQTPEEKAEKEAQLTEGLAALDAVTAKYSGTGATMKELKRAVAAVKRRFRVFKSIDVVADGEAWDYVYVASPPRTKDGPKKVTMEFKLREGGLRAMEGRVLQGKKAGKTVHLYSKHVDIAEAKLEARLEDVRQSFLTQRADKIAEWQAKVDELQPLVKEPYSRPAPTSSKERKVIKTLTERQEDYEGNVAKLKHARDELKKLRMIPTDNRKQMLLWLERWKKPGDPMIPEMVTKFHSSDVMERAVTDAIAKNGRTINRGFTQPDGEPKALGESVNFDHPFKHELGIGYEFNAQGEVVETSRQLTTIHVTLTLDDREQGLFVVETAYPT